jgi:hypothetical protein
MPPCWQSSIQGTFRANWRERNFTAGGRELFASRSREAGDSVLVNGARGTRDIQGKATRVRACEWSRGDARDIDGQNREVEMGGST